MYLEQLVAFLNLAFELLEGDDYFVVVIGRQIICRGCGA